MNKSFSFLKKILKLLLWVIISFLLLFILIAVTIRIPSVQNKIVSFATSFISDKTHTKVNLNKVSLSFPKSLILEGIYLEDLQKDTLLYAGIVKVNIAIKDLFNSNIHVSSFSLEEVNVHLNRIEADSLFNFNFLITAFSDPSAPKKTETKKGSKWKITVDNIDLRKIQFRFKDDYGGTDFSADLKQLTLKMDNIDVNKLIFDVDELLIDSLSTKLFITKSTTTTETTKSANALPLISANKIRISNTSFLFGDSVGRQSIIAGIDELKLEDASVDIQKQIISCEEISLAKSNFRYNRNDKMPSDTIIVVVNTDKVKNDWGISIKKIDLEDNSLAYMVENKTEIKDLFDPSHQNHKHLSLKADNFYYSSLKTEVSVKEFSSTDQNGFAVTKLETDFFMDGHSIIAKNVKAKTLNSSIDADLGIKFTSLSSLRDSLQFMIVNAEMKKMTVQNSEILYFAPQLIKQPFFNNKSNITTVSGNIKGPLNNLTGKNLAVHTGVNTNLNTDFIIAGLPYINTTYFNFPNLRVNSGSKDIIMMAGTFIPKSIELPESISMEIVFKGQLKSFETTVGLSSSYGSSRIFAIIDKNENFSSKATVTHFDLGRLLKNKEMFGPLSLTAEATGHGLDKKTIYARVRSEVSEIYLNKYTYHDLKIDGSVDRQSYQGKISLNDKNAVFNFDGLVNLNPAEEVYKFNLDLQGADLQKLHFTDKNIQIGLQAMSDLKGGTAKEINGKAGITKIIVSHEGKKYLLDSFLVASVNEKNRSELTVSSTLIGIKYNGNFSPVDLPKELNKFINRYFPFTSNDQSKTLNEIQNFNFAVQLHNHPILSEVFFPSLTEFEPGLITGSFDSEKSELKFNASIGKIIYGPVKIEDLLLDVNSDITALNYSVSCSNISNDQIKLDNLIVSGKLADQIIYTGVSSIDEEKNKKLQIRSQIIKNNDNYRLTLEPDDFYLMNDRWNIATDNYVEFGKQGLLIHNLFFNKTESQINIASVHDKYNDDLNIEIKNFMLEDISGIIEKDTSLVKGNVDGNILLKRVNNSYGLIADARISDLIVRDVPIGNLTLKAENPTLEKFDIEMNLSGAENNLSAKGYFVQQGENNSVNIKTDIQTLSLKSVQALSLGSITKASGTLTGNLSIEGPVKTPDIIGELVFNNAFITPAALNNQLQLKHETILLKKNGIYFNSFTLLDDELHSAVIDGSVKMEHFKNLFFALSVNTKDFLLINTTAKDNEEFFGKMIIDSRIDVKGPIAMPVVDAKIKMKKGSNFTFAVSEKEVSTDKGEDVVEFDDSLKLNPILNRNIKKAKQKSSLTGFEISSIIEIDKQATLRLLMDPSSTDSLVVRGEAGLSFSIDRSGKMSLTGAYYLNEGSYLVSLESVIKRKFNIDPGSTIIWNGDPMEAQISINAIYSVRASPIDLVADQMAGLSETDLNGYKQRYPFLVVLKLRGEIAHPEISFEIQLPPEEKGILGGSVNAKLNMLNEDPSALNKQVFALLILGRFTQENPLQTETNAVSAVARTTVGKFLSAQLNQLSSKVVPGVELNFDVQSYDEYQTGQEEGRTEVEIGVKKQLFNERLAVQVGGSVDVEGERAKQNSASDITSDVTLEYKLTKDGRYRLKAFRHNQYGGALEGDLVETGAGILYIRDFNKWKEFFRKPKNKTVEQPKIISNEPLENK